MIVLLVTIEELGIPDDFVRMHCQGCACLGWVAPQSARMPVMKLCESCYWLKLQIDEPQQRPVVPQ